jgi:microcompartment protein CcmL/EutN
VRLAELHLADGLGGKAYFVLFGDQADVEAGLHAAEMAIPTGLLLARELIARPHEDLLTRFRT